MIFVLISCNNADHFTPLLSMTSQELLSLAKALAERHQDLARIS